jgi:N-acetylglucosamine-6-sulfatase
VATSPPVGASDRPPDIVVIMVDDLPQLDGRLWQPLPTIRQTFVERGITFTGFHGESPLCCPGRAGWLTGQHTHNHGVGVNDARLFDPAMTLATQLDGIGYETVLAGKYLNLYHRIAPSVPPGWHHFHAMEGGYFDYRMWNDGAPGGQLFGSAATDYSTDVIKTKVLAHIRDAPADTPLFAFISVFAPHGPRQPAPRHESSATCTTIPAWAPPNYNEADVSDKPAWLRAKPMQSAPAYDLVSTCRTMLSVDDLVRGVRNKLARYRNLDDTLIVLTSDNGMNAGAHRLLGKGTPYATGVSFLVSWPGRLGSRSRTVDERLSNIDLAPTLCEIAGCELGPYPNGQQRPDGRSFASLLTGQADSIGRDAVLESMIAGERPWHAVATTEHSPLARTVCGSAPSSGCRWHYVEYRTGERELYDVSNGPCWNWKTGMSGDPCELRNVAGRTKFAAVQAALAKRLAELKSE